jgi:hypothetical protein
MFKTVVGLQLLSSIKTMGVLFGAIMVIVIFLLALIIQVLVFILLLIAMIFMARDKTWRLITDSSIIGILLGIWQHSYVWGFGSGALVTTLGFIANWVDKAIVEIRPINVFKSGPYISAYQYLEKNLLNPIAVEEWAAYLGD